MRFVTALTVLGALCFVVGLSLSVLPLDVLSLPKMLTPDGSFDPIVEYAVSGLENGLILGGFALLALASLFFLCERRLITIFDWPLARFMILIIGLQFAFGLVYITHVTYIPTADFEWYHRQAANIAHGQSVSTEFGEPTAYWPIGYSLVLSVFYRLFGAKLIVAQIVGLCFNCTLTYVAYLLASEILDSRIARRVALIMGLLPSGILYTIIPIADIPFTLLVSLMIYLTLRKATFVNVTMLGLCLGFGTLMRPVLFFYPFILAGYRILRGQKWRTALVHILLTLGIGEGILLPWQIRNYRAFGDFVFVSNNGGRHLLMGNNDNASGGYVADRDFIPSDSLLWYHSLNEVRKDKYAFGKALYWMLHNPVKAISLWPKKIFFLFYRDSKCVTYGLNDSYAQMSPLIIISLVGITEGYYYSLGFTFLLSAYFLIKKRRMSPSLWLVNASILYFIVVHLPFITEGRYHMPLLPLFAIVACVPRSYFDIGNQKTGAG